MRGPNLRPRWALLPLGFAVLAAQAAGSDAPQRCAAIGEDRARLACYDAIFRKPAAPVASAAAPDAAATPVAVAGPAAAAVPAAAGTAAAELPPQPARKPTSVSPTPPSGRAIRRRRRRRCPRASPARSPPSPAGQPAN